MKATATTTQTPYGTELEIILPDRKSKIKLNFQPAQSDLLFAVQKAIMENQVGVIANQNEI